MKPFKNEVYIDWSKPSELKKQQQAIKDVEKRLGKKYPLIIDGEKVFTEDSIVSINPSHRSEIVVKFSKATVHHAELALHAGLRAFETWKNVDPKKRADYLFKAAAEFRRRRYEINAWMILEVGKNYLEADADTCEAIDFLEFYGREMLRYANPPKPLQLKGERDELQYIPLGVGIVIPPWNFPLAILTGMTCAAIVTGNTVVLKPSSDSPMMGQLLMETLEKIKLPKGVVNFLPGPGGEVGDFLVSHPKTRFISFTGSKEVGLHINELAAKHQPGQKWIKRIVAEMGGKDSIVVDADTDVDAAAKGTVAAAFGFQGQKCSACSRAIVVSKVYDKFVSKVVEYTNALSIGEAKSNMNVGPVINERAENTILNYIAIGKKEGKLVAGGTKAIGNGNFIEPTVIADVPPNARIAQEEIFGPVLAIIKAKDFDDAIAIANNTEYGLTGAVYTKSKKKIEQAKRDFFCGNLYINRKCTGAMVAAHPFGGFNMSGTDSKAGGSDYLLLFLQAKSIGEKIK
ncbi:MAG TPA: L-glutamate gamma-semialdehyde dehydrogenase [Candidatus Kapabacteria bacterium]|nr:L-glutamate gamma-semialdehyde dehydrogenase [Candidatus Kapabacteria bacterium]